MKARMSTTDGFIECEVSQIATIEGRKVFIHSTKDDEYEDCFLYKVSDWESGYGMSMYQETIDEAIGQATELCKKYGPEKVKELADAAIAKHGRANE